MDALKQLKVAQPQYFKNVRQAGAYLSQETGIDQFNASDCIYKALRESNKTHSTHGYVVQRAADKQITLSRIIKDEQ